MNNNRPASSREAPIRAGSRRRIALAALAALALLAGVPAGAATPAQVFQVKGSAANATFLSLDATGCIETDVTLFNSAGLVRQLPDGATSNVETTVGISRFNRCTGLLLLQALGGTTGASLEIAGNLGSATLTATLQVVDILSGRSFDVSVNAIWTATGPLQHSETNSHFHGRGFVSDQHFNGFNRPATATATVVIDGTNVTPLPSIGAELDRETVGGVTVQPL